MIGQGYKKTIQTLKAISTVASAAQSISSVLTTKKAIQTLIFIDFGLDSATAPVGTEFLIQASEASSGNDTWRKIDGALRVTGTTTPNAIATDNLEAIGQTVIECGATVPVLGDIVFFKNATLANSEWSKVVARDATGGTENFTIRDALTYAQASGTYYNKGEYFIIPIDLRGITRLRVVCNNNYAASSASCVWRCVAITTDLVDGAVGSDLATVA